MEGGGHWCAMKKKSHELFWLHMVALHVIKLWYIVFTIFMLIFAFKYYNQLELIGAAVSRPFNLMATIVNGTQVTGTIGH
jgi:hypothetical protein